jgi:glycosyltransferase involved in cell wall biosynthesis
MRILACGEFTQISSGYSVYMREILSRLRNVPGVEIAELASFCSPDDPRIMGVPWKVYPVIPDKNNQDATNEYHSNPTNAFGAGLFNHVLLDFKPTHVIDIRDSWHMEHEFRSPLRPYYAHVVMPAIDAIPQHRAWIDMYAKADKLLSYTDWGIEVMKNAGLKNTYYSASPCAPNEYSPIDAAQKQQLKDSLGLGKVKILGTVMRNQRRKLFPDLFRDFKRFLVESNRNDIFLLCHTSNPDTWDFDELLLEHGLGKKVLFTYLCKQCRNIEVSFYKGIFAHCNRCNTMNLTFSSTQHSVDNQAMNLIFNMMDMYIQYAVCEGYGMPLAEALACGVPIAGIDYSAMGEILSQAEGYKIRPISLNKEAETGRFMAAPNPEDTMTCLHDFFGLSDEEQVQKGEFERILYGMRSYDDVARVWLNALNECQPSKPWNAPPVNYQTDIRVPQNVGHSDYARWLISNVLQDPSYIGSYMEARLVKDISNGFACRGFDGKYYHEDISGRGQQLVEFDREKAAKHFGALLEEKQMWENRRVSSLK